MAEITLYFEFFDRKMKTTVEADSVEQAQNIIRNKIIFHETPPKAAPKSNVNNDAVVDQLMGMFNLKR